MSQSFIRPIQFKLTAQSYTNHVQKTIIATAHVTSEKVYIPSKPSSNAMKVARTLKNM